ncbi:Molybdenum cofactor guanylyltransferase [bioreactor metagenome]|uniref:Molybdenum cofactor guanylyltransferase n=1 Tax=bioreactor metagenome TaxID=1076179 RepID=A0A645A868_9ZZZZ|nr:nucleotidyltransferase family protein [Christensenella sp.]
MKIGCALLAAGAGRRFGDGKLLYEVDGVPMISRALSLYAPLGFSARVCVTREEALRIRHLAKEGGFAVAVNPDPERGVGTSVSIATEVLLAKEPALDGILYAVSDQPYLAPESARRLMEAFRASPERIASLGFDGIRGNPAIFPKDLFGELMGLTEDIGGGAVIRRHPERLLLIEAGSARELQDIDMRETSQTAGKEVTT